MPAAPPDFRALFESAPGSYLVLAPDYTIVAASDAYLQATMTRREDIVGRGIFDVFPDNPDDPNATGVHNLSASLGRVGRTYQPDTMAVQKYDIRRPASEGGGFEERYWSPVNYPVVNPCGELVYIVHRVKDVTDVVLLKERGEQMEIEMFRRAQEIQQANERLRELNRELTDLHVELETRVRNRTTELAWANTTLRAEIVERRRSEALVAEQRERLRVTLSSIGDGVIVCEPDGRVAFLNPVAESLTGWKQADAVGKPLDEVFIIINEESRQFVESPVQKVLVGGAAIGLANSTTLIARDGTERPIDDSGAPIRDDQGTIRGVVLVFRDVSDRRRAEQAKARLAAIVESSEDAIFARALDGTITTWNPGAEHLTGYAAAEVIGRPVTMMIPIDQSLTFDEITRRLTLGEAVAPFEAIRLGKDGKRLELSIMISPIRDKRGNVSGASVIARDISTTKQLEAQFRQAQKMEAVGLLAGGVAHDFNNLLTITSGYSEILLRRLPADEVSKKMIQEIYKAGERATLLTRQLLAFSRKQVLEPKVIDLNAIVTEASRMLERLIGADVRLATTLAPNLGAVKADPGQIEQVVMNLVINSRDAMPQGGNLTIETANVDLDKAFAQTHLEVKPGPHVMLAVTDTGHGMDETTLAHIFEPFFTTKEPGRGTGLGLATVYGIVKQSGGCLYVYSERGRGTTFKIYLPRIMQPKVSTAKSFQGFKPALVGSETILLVEDDPGVRTITTVALQAYGYAVLQARGGDEAIAIFDARKADVAMLVTDLIMPGMSGRQVVEALLPRKPTMKVLYMSGYTDDAVVRHGVLNAETAFLQKPFTPIALVTKVREVLDAPKDN